MRHEFHPEAVAEYRAAALYYSKRDPAVGRQFVGAVEDALDRICNAPRRWRVLDEDVRRCLTRVFPYGVLYTVERDYVLIVAVTHCSRQPGTGRGVSRSPEPCLGADERCQVLHAVLSPQERCPPAANTVGPICSYAAGQFICPGMLAGSCPGLMRAARRG